MRIRYVRFANVIKSVNFRFAEIFLNVTLCVTYRVKHIVSAGYIAPKAYLVPKAPNG